MYNPNRDRCGDCVAYQLWGDSDIKGHCHRYPEAVEKRPIDWCREFARELPGSSEKKG